MSRRVFLAVTLALSASAIFTVWLVCVALGLNPSARTVGILIFLTLCFGWGITSQLKRDTNP